MIFFDSLSLLGVFESRWLIEMGLKSTMVCGIVFAIVILLHRAESAARHRVIVVGLFGLVLLPLGSAVIAPLLPNWNVPILSGTVLTDDEAPDTTLTPLIDREMKSNASESGNSILADANSLLPPRRAPIQSVGSGSQQNPLGDRPSQAAQPPQVSAVVSSQPADAGTPLPAESAAIIPGLPTALLLGAIWLVGTSLFVLHWLVARFAASRIVSESRLIDLDGNNTDPSLKRIQEIARELGVRTCPRVRLTSNEHGPMVIGVIRPTILLPAQFKNWSRDQQRSIVVHEMAHVARRDLLTDSLGRISHALFWWNPLVWVLRNRQEQEREKACDEQAVSLLGVAEDYAQHLVSAVRDIRNFTVAPCIPMARSSDLSDRVTNILNCPERAGRFRKASVAMVLVLMASIGVLSPLGIVALAETSAVGETNPQESVSDAKGDQEAQAEKVKRDKATAKRAAEREATLQKRYGDKITKLISAKGKVVDEAGKPLKGIEVCLRETPRFRLAEEGSYSFRMTADELDRNNYVIARTKSNAKGEFEFANIKTPEFRRFKDKPRWSIIAVSPGHALAWEDLTTNENLGTLKLTLQAEHPIVGQVVDPSGNPIAGATIYADRVHSLTEEFAYFGDPPPFFELGKSELSSWAVSDSEGKFQLKGLPADRIIDVRVYHGEFVEGDFLIATTDQPQQDIKMERGRTGRRGEFTLKVHSDNCKIEMAKGYQVDFQVVDPSGKPLPGLAGSVYRKSVNQWTRFTTDEEGRYQSPCYAESDLFVGIRAGKEDEWMNVFEEIEFADGQFKKEFKIKVSDDSSLYGIAKDDAGKPVAGIHAYFIPDDQFMGRSYSVTYSKKTKADGSFRIPCPEGVVGTVYFGRDDKDLTFDLPNQLEIGLGHDNQKKEPRFSSDFKFSPAIDLKGTEHRSASDPLEVTIKRAATLKGRVVDEKGDPVSLPVFDMINRRRFSANFGATIDPTLPTAHSDMSGEFEINGIQERFSPIYKVTGAEGEKSAMVRFDQLEDPTNVEVRIGEGVKVEGKVTLDGKPMKDHPVELKIYLRFDAPKDHWSHGGYAYELPWTKTTTDADGVYTFSSAPAGVKLKVQTERGERDQLEHSLTSNRDFAANGIATAKDFDFVSLTGSVSGVVVDPEGNPIENAKLTAYEARDAKGQYGRRRAFTGRNGIWEPVITGADGKFTMDNVPENVKLELSVYYHPTATSGPGGTSLWHQCNSGDKDVKVVLDKSLARKPKKRR